MASIILKLYVFSVAPWSGKNPLNQPVLTSNVTPGGKSALSPATIENSSVSPSQSNPMI